MSAIQRVFRGSQPGPSEDRTRLLVPVVGNESDDRLLNYVARIAQRKNAEITLIYVVEVDQELPLDAELPAEVTHGESVLQNARNHVKQAIDTKSSVISTDMLQARLAGPAIVDEAIADHSDAIVMSAKVYKRLGKRTCGDTVDYVLRNAPCEVVILRGAMANALVQELEIEIE